MKHDANFRRLPAAVQAVWNAIDPGEKSDGKIEAHFGGKRSLPGIGTCYTFGVDSAPRDLIDTLKADFADSTHLTLLRYNSEHESGDELWLGTVAGAVLEVNLDLPDGERANGFLYITLTRNAAAAARALEQSATKTADHWITETCAPLAAEFDELTPERLGARLPEAFRDRPRADYQRFLTALAAACQHALARL